MSDQDTTNDKASGKRTLSLKPSTGTVRQSFSHGRSNSVVVEKRKRRVVVPGQEAPAQETSSAPAPKVAVQTKRRVVKPGAAPKAEAGPAPTSRTATTAEQEARLTALKEAQQREVEEAKRAAEEAKRRAAEEERLKKEAEEEARRQAEEAARAAEEEARRAKSKDKPADAEPVAAAPAKRKVEATEDEAPRRGGDIRGKRAAPTPAKPTPRTDERRKSKLTINRALSDDGGSQRGRSLAAMRRRQEKARRGQQQTGPREKVLREVTIPDAITIQELANRMAERAVDVIKILMQQGQMLKINDVIDADTAQLIAEELGHTVKRVSEADVEEGLFSTETEDDDGEAQPRPPVVTIMGHVDHGKTSLLDAIRNANVVAGEAGGITQHIGAYQVEKNDQKISFIDTPGHEAFTSMRARGAKATDIVILVVAADDSVMPTTVEAINHTRAGDVPMIVAINKMDKPEADPNRVRTDLLRYEVQVEGMGGEVQDVEVSATTGQGLDNLLDAILLQSEIMELKANPDRAAEGVVIEAQLDKGRGPVATVLVQKGTLKKGDILVAGGAWARIRALVNDRGEQVDEAGPSAPVEVLGFQDTPSAGDPFAVVESEARAREITEYRQRQLREKTAARLGSARGSLEQMMTRLQESNLKEFPILVKGDVQGSVEAIAQAVEKLGNDEVAARVIHAAPGGVTESDVALAAASEAPIIAFNVRANKQARDAAQSEGIEIRQYSIIYDLVDDIKAAMEGLLSPERRETELGNAEILEVFNITKVGKVAGCMITDGKVERGAGVRLIRDNVVIHEGKLKTLKRFKDEVPEVNAGQECGMAFENYEDIRKGDVIECFRIEEVARKL
ncbi:MAG: translation initiation factor IF-2 [Devosiaceae bacterium]|nr:translation initiation factor IF-2 [Devosiaceae bacterium MH13]